MINLIKFHMSDGIMKLFLDTPIKPSSKITFRHGLNTYNDFWNVSK